MNIDVLMTREVVSVSPDTTLFEVQTHFREKGFHHVLVVGEEGELVGVLSDRDVLEAASPYFDTLVEEPRDVRALMKTAGETVKEDPITIETGTSVQRAAELLLERDISCLPVLGAEGEIAGIVTSSDILHYTSGL